MSKDLVSVGTPKVIDPSYGLTAYIIYIETPKALKLHVGGDVSDITCDLNKLIKSKLVKGRDLIVLLGPPNIEDNLHLPFNRCEMSYVFAGINRKALGLLKKVILSSIALLILGGISYIFS